MSNNTLRPCMALELKWRAESKWLRALFHTWVIRQEQKPSGQIMHHVYALVELENGCLWEVPKEHLIFTDTPEQMAPLNFNWPPDAEEQEHDDV